MISAYEGRFEICKSSKANSFQVNFIVTNKNKTLFLAFFFFKSVQILPNFALCEGHAPPKPEKLIFENIGFIIFKRTGFATQFRRSNR